MEKISIPFWKKTLSYLFPIRLETSYSDVNKLLVVNLHKGRLQLLTENAIYSYDDLYDNFDEAFKQLNLTSKDTQEILVLGLGLGSVPYLLEKKYGIAGHITAVEIDEEVIRLASSYSLHRLKSGIDCVCADAFIFLEITSQKFDLICMDVFQDELIPEEFTSEGFLHLIKKKLRPNGILLFNHLATTSQDKLKAEDYFKQIFLKIFPNATIIATRHNYILCSVKVDISRQK